MTAHLFSARDDLPRQPGAFAQRVLAAVAFGILLVAAAVVIHNGTSVETHPAHFLTRVSH